MSWVWLRVWVLDSEVGVGGSVGVDSEVGVGGSVGVGQ